MLRNIFAIGAVVALSATSSALTPIAMFAVPADAQGVRSKMRLRLISSAFAISFLPVTANAQLTIDMNAINCGQYLAMSPAMSRDFSAWMSGWFSYQTRRTFVDLALHQKNIANLKAWCQYHPQDSVMTGLQNGIGPQ